MNIHFEVVIVSNGVVSRKGIVTTDAAAAITKALTLVSGSKVEDVERVAKLGAVDG